MSGVSLKRTRTVLGCRISRTSGLHMQSTGGNIGLSLTEFSFSTIPLALQLSRSSYPTPRKHTFRLRISIGRFSVTCSVDLLAESAQSKSPSGTTALLDSQSSLRCSETSERYEVKGSMSPYSTGTESA